VNEAELLFSSVLNSDRLSLHLNKGSHLEKDKSFLISSVLKRRISSEPIQYILGKTEFMGLEFKVGPGVFIPRPETEILVETAIKQVTRSPCLSGRQAGHQVTSLDILDVGTGSGCIAISLAKLLPYAAITATDISDKALAAAMENADLNGAKVNFVQGDLFCGLPPGSYDLVVSNPPYIPSPEIQNLQPEIRHEPIVALDGGSDGLDFYRRMIKDAPQYLKENSYFIMEIGFNQKDSIKDIFQKNKNFKVIDIVQDYNNIDRIIIAKREDRWIN